MWPFKSKLEKARAKLRALKIRYVRVTAEYNRLLAIKSRHSSTTLYEIETLVDLAGKSAVLQERIAHATEDLHLAAEDIVAMNDATRKDQPQACVTPASELDLTSDLLSSLSLLSQSSKDAHCLMDEDWYEDVYDLLDKYRQVSTDSDTPY